MSTFSEVSPNHLKDAFLALFSSVKESFLKFTFIDAIDILLLAVMFFFTFRFLKSRKAGALLIGILVISALSIITYVFNMSASYTVLSSFIKVGMFALIIIFQPEIREALDKIGSGSVTGIKNFGDQNKKITLYTKAIDNICTAVNDLSSTKTGALIVLTRTTKINEVETGITINADTNSFLIRNLFFDKSPLHDGAIIIDEGRIVAAGCVLPLTRRTDVDGNLGTRHRAAIGMSEISDAVIVVVSEETGIISVACDCELIRDFTVDTLRSYLTKKFFGKNTPEAED